MSPRKTRGARSHKRAGALAPEASGVQKSEKQHKRVKITKEAEVLRGSSIHQSQPTYSDDWTSLQKLDAKSTGPFAEVIENGNFPYLCSEALRLRKTLLVSDKQVPHDELTCTMDKTKFTNGWHNVVFKILFSDLVCWIARVRLPRQGEVDDDIQQKMLSEIATMKLVREKTKAPVPRVFGHDVDAKGPFGFRYILMEEMPGRILDSSFTKSVPEPYKEKVAGQLAEYFIQISRIRFSTIGRVWCGAGVGEEPRIIPVNAGVTGGPFKSALDYFYYHRKEANREILQGNPRNEDVAIASLILEEALPFMVYEENIGGPFPLCHVDFHYGNIMFDDEYNITAIIDWENAQTVPLERYIAIPEFITPPALSKEKKQQIRDFCAMFIKALKEKEQEADYKAASGGSRLLSDMVGTPLSELVYRCTCSFPWRALSDAKLVLRLIYGDEEIWDIRKTLYKARLHGWGGPL